MKPKSCITGVVPSALPKSRNIARRRKKARAPLIFTDLNATDLTQWKVSKDQATRRLHARKDGQIISGFPAFLILWRELPRMRWLARLLSLPVLRQVADIGYNALAAPLLYRMHLRREAKRA